MATTHHRVFRRRFATILAAAMLSTLIIVAPFRPGPAAALEGAALADARATIFAATNAAREAAGLPPLTMNSRLNDVAQRWSEQQAAVGAMSHNPSYAAQYPAGWFRAAENVAAGYSVNTVVNAWMNSPGHAANITNPDTNYIGIGIGSRGGYLYYTQNFAAYRSPPPGTNIPGSAAPSWDVNIERLAGSDRYTTAVQIARQFSGSIGTLYIASGENYPDALSAAPAAARGNAPLLLTRGSVLPADVASAVRDLQPDEIVIVGGPAVVSDRVYREVAGYSTTIRREFGADRYETSRKITRSGWPRGSAPVVYIATGQNYPDALSAASAAGMGSAPVILVRSQNASSPLDAETADLLAYLGTRTVHITGGEGVVSPRIASDLRKLPTVSAVHRFAGADRFETSLLAAREAATTSNNAVLATGLGFADALAGAPLAAARGAAMYLARPDCIPSAIVSEITAQDADIVTLLGGDGVLNSRVAAGRAC